MNNSVSVHFEMRPLNTDCGYMLISKFDNIPQLSNSIYQIDGWSLMCPSHLTIDGLLTYFIDNQQTSKHQSIIFGIRELNPTEVATHCSSIPSNPPIPDRPLNLSSNYEVRMFTSGCYYLDSNLNWQSDGLLVGPLTNHIRTQCFSTHLSTFAGSYLIFPSVTNQKYVSVNVDFSKSRNIYLTMIILIFIYGIFLIYSLYRDKSDVEKLVVTILADNRPTDKYFYQIVVFTGTRNNSQGNATVELILSGGADETDVRTLFDSDRKILQGGSIDSFLLAVSKSLGCLTMLRVWLNNSGENCPTSWFFKYAIVRDLQTMERFYFICRQKLTAEANDRSIECVLSAIKNCEKQKLCFTVINNVYDGILNDHLWFSIFFQRFSSYLTRVQRCTCCFVLLFTGMLISILYYDQRKQIRNDDKVNGLFIGPFLFSAEQMIIGLIIDIVLFIPITLLALFFERIRRRQSLFQISPIVETVLHIRLMEVLNTNDLQQKKRKKVLLFPWWCSFIAYGLSFIMINVSMVLIITHGIEFDDVKVKKWRGTFVAAFLSSVLLTQSIKVIGLPIFSALISRRGNKKRETTGNYIDKNENFYLNGGVEYIQSIQNNSLISVQPHPQDIEDQQCRNIQGNSSFISSTDIRTEKIDQPLIALSMTNTRSLSTQNASKTSSAQHPLTTKYHFENISSFNNKK